MSSRNVSASQAGAPRQQRPEGGEDRATVARVRVKEERRHAAEEVRGGGGLAGAAERGGEDAERGGVRGRVRRDAEEHGGGRVEERRGRPR
jgi:hypothetical protein